MTDISKITAAAPAETKAEAPRPVSEWENNNVSGQACTCKRVHEKHVEEVKALRQRQEAYEASLPKEPLEALRAISAKMVVFEDQDDSSEAIRAALTLINELATHRIDLDYPDMHQALYWLTSEALTGFKEIERSNREAYKIARQFSPSHEPFRA
ncbi:hypothetical protein [Litorisediminicola beolgyonensis]|uniref:Uncharacterized protein n=1 Tax=Litorisediminicola beolgyonensis TaxID=1173614 RepID=A0ABW3ZFF9_9RHOB